MLYPFVSGINFKSSSQFVLYLSKLKYSFQIRIILFKIEILLPDSYYTFYPLKIEILLSDSYYTFYPLKNE